jgi:hypothetical protein
MVMKQPLFSLQRHVFQKVMTFVFLILPPLCHSQVLSAETNNLQNLLDNAESEGNIEQLLDLDDELKRNRILLNEADADDLRQLPWLKTADVEAILIHRRDNGPILSLEQLETIIGKEKTAHIAPYIRFTKEPTSRQSGKAKAVAMDGALYSRLFWETTARKGILNGNYAGENYKLYHRLQVSAPHLKATLLQEKDIGEPDVADFTALSISASDLGIMKQAVLGNYKLSLAQGLLIGQGRYFSKGSDPTGSVRLPSRQLLPYTSSSEYGFLQGAATTLKLEPFEVTLFYSANHRDAVINDEGVITSFSTSGYHRTELETSRKDNVTETIYGANILYHYQRGLFSGRAGGSVLNYNYPLPIDELEPSAAQPSLSSATLCSFETDLSLGHASLFAEAAFSSRPDDASWTAGVEYQILKGLSTVAALRRYGASYYSPFANAFAERGSDASNEQGYYIGLNAKVSDRLSVAAYYDLFTFPLLDNHCPYPSDGNDARLFIIWKQSPLLTWNLQFQHKYKEEQSNQGTSSHPLWTALPQITNRCRLDCDVKLSRSISLRSRGEVKKVVKEYLAGDEDFYGWLLYQQAGYSTGKFSLKGRFTVFNTEDYDAALYAYEDDLPLTSSLGMYDGRGKSLFLVATWQALSQLKLAARYETTWYSDREVYSSGNDERATSAPGSFHLGCSLTF